MAQRYATFIEILVNGALCSSEAAGTLVHADMILDSQDKQFGTMDFLEYPGMAEFEGLRPNGWVMDVDFLNGVGCMPGLDLG